MYGVLHTRLEDHIHSSQRASSVPNFAFSYSFPRFLLWSQSRANDMLLETATDTEAGNMIVDHHR